MQLRFSTLREQYLALIREFGEALAVHRDYQRARNAADALNYLTVRVLSQLGVYLDFYTVNCVQVFEDRIVVVVVTGYPKTGYTAFARVVFERVEPNDDVKVSIYY